MAISVLQLPVDIPWRRVRVSMYMIDADVCDRRKPLEMLLVPETISSISSLNLSSAPSFTASSFTHETVPFVGSSRSWTSLSTSNYSC